MNSVRGIVRSGLQTAVFLCVTSAWAGLDLNSNQQSDLWENHYNATGLTANADSDNDGVNNRNESIAGTDPFDTDSVPEIQLRMVNQQVLTEWESYEGKQYLLQTCNDLATGTWQTAGTYSGIDDLFSNVVAATASNPIYRIAIQDVDTDGDQLTDWEELQLDFNPDSAHTERYNNTDYTRVSTTWNSMSTVSVVVLDGEISERWPDAGVIAIRRGGGIRPITVNFSIAGSATRNTDYTMPSGNTIEIPAGIREVWIEFFPVADSSDGEPTETITLTALTGTNYVLATNISATVNLANETTNSLPNPKAAARFLVQAAFGPDADSTNDVDIIPENVETLQGMGFEAWIDDQFTQPVGLIQPFVEYAETLSDFYIDSKEASWWNRAMGVTELYPGGPTVTPDPLRQRVALALSEILVIADRPETLAVNPIGMANYHDMLLTNAFGNYRDLLFNVSLHPCMGVYLSHLRNQKADPANNIFPDENYAREIMQLFSIGLWQLNQDGTRQLDTNGLPIPTYDNATITELARVFTGLSYGGPLADNFWASEYYLEPMKLWDEYHDCDAKTILNGVTIPARTESNPDTGTAALADINDAVDVIFNHTNVAPFISKQLIQRFVTSNPSTGYVARVAAKFNNNGSGVRGDMKAVIKAILLDTEARDPTYMSDPTFGKQREPFLRVVNFARAFNASSPWGYYALDNFSIDHYQEPFNAPSVFNFFLPGYAPPGPITDAGLVAPEFQILNAGSAISSPNYYYNAVRGDLHPWGSGNTNRTVSLDITQELALVNNIDEMIRRLDLSLTYGTLQPREFQLIREAIPRIPTWQWQRDYEIVYLVIYLMVTSPEFCVMR